MEMEDSRDGVEPVQGTADEVDVGAAAAEMRPAPSPSDAVMHSDAVDVSYSSSSSNHTASTSERVPEMPPQDLDLNAADVDPYTPNDGSQSPARAILELPPALDLSEVVPGARLQPDSGAGNGNLDVPEGSSSIFGSNPSIDDHAVAAPSTNTDTPQNPVIDHMEDVPLASPTTDVVLLQSNSEQTVRTILPSSGLGIFANPNTSATSSVSGHAGPPSRPPLMAGQQPLPPPSPGLADSNAPPGQPQSGPPPPPPKQPIFAYHHDDSDTTMAELEEFFSYVEVRGVVEEGREAWSRGWEDTGAPDWPDAPSVRKKAHINHLIEELEHRDPEIRFEAARRMAYIAHGTPVYSTSPQHHLHLVISNCSLLREAGALTAVHEALKSAGGRWNAISAIPESDNTNQYPGQQYYPSLTPQERQEYLEEINGELAIHLSVLYFLVEVFRGDESWADELMALDPPLPIYLINLVAGLREKNAKGYPVKKLLLLLWKSLLACLGGNKDITRVKKLVREIESLPMDLEEPEAPTNVRLKATPLDFATFQGDIINKYPTYQPPVIPIPIPQIPLERIVAAAASAPLRNVYHQPSPTASSSQLPPVNQPPNGQAAGPLPATPAPSPPPSPPPAKPKKQQYQTDQTKPFVLPFSVANLGGGHYSSIKGKGKMTVPFSIDEAGKLYKRNIRITTELWQMWKLREEYLADETGVGAETSVDDEPTQANGPSLAGLGRHFENMSLDDGFMSFDQRKSSKIGAAEDARPDALSMLYQLERNLKQDLKELKKAGVEDDGNRSSRAEQKKLAQRISDVKKLQRIELIYRSTLPNMQSAVIVLLKLLLATVTANTNANANVSEGEILPPQSLEDTDIMRHREITSKAVSAILILTLRWFKTSHAMKFHYLAHLLVDSNCLLLILKMFGLQEVSNQVRMRNEVEEWNFFQFCHLYASQNPAPARPEDSMLRARSQPMPALNEDGTLKATEEPEIITNFSWRNFFSVINFVHVLQKLTKRKAHRILLLVQYKSSAILKRILKVSHPLLQLYVLKVIKSQVPYCGRKWRQSNMKVITAIYLNCRPDLRDEWLTTIDIDSDSDETLPHEQTLRTLVKFFNTKHYSAFAPQLHRRSSSHLGHIAGSGFQLDGGSHLNGPAQGSIMSQHQPPPSPGGGFHSAGSSHGFFEGESFPPARPLSTFGADEHYRTSYIPDSLMDGYLEDYEDLLGDLFTPVYDAQGMPISGAVGSGTGAGGYVGSPGGSLHHMPGGMSPSRALGDGMSSSYMSNAEQAWHRLSEVLGEADSISDSESVASIGFLNVSADSEGSEYASEDGSQTGRSDWEHLSPDLAIALEEEEEERAREHRQSPNRRRRSASPRSPGRIRRSSSGTPRSPALRPVLMNIDNQNDDEEEDGEGGSAVEEEDDEEEPIPMTRSPRRSPHLSPQRIAIDEVEAFFE